jgi:UDP-2,3-diacylglucosamine hydrolase
MIVIADSHVGEENGNVAEFRETLAKLGKSRDDVVFLGDIFELWIALPAYEQPLHREFMDWCDAEKGRRSVGFIEGNHEFFVAEERAAHFTWCVGGAWRNVPGCLLVHGDRIDRRDRGYRLLRRTSKTPLMKTMLRLAPPLGRALISAAKERLDRKGTKRMPADQIRAFAEAEFAGGVKAILAGHFHQYYAYAGPEGCSLHILPAWLDTGIVTRFDPVLKQVRCCHWREM